MTTHLVTSALPYINGTKHLGTLVGSLLPADVFARAHRAEGHDVRFVCGTDDHGAPAELAAAASGRPVAQHAARCHARQADLYRQLDLSFDHFGRTADPDHHAWTLEVYHRLDDAGLIERRPLRQLYSPTDGRSLSDRYIVGTCPHCGDPDARGDQCDHCGRLLDPTELLAPRSALSGATDLELRTRTHAYLRLSALQDDARAYVDAHASSWPDVSVHIARSWLDAGLRDRCITRELSWGVPVPDLPGLVFWCWFDAPLAYAGLARAAGLDAFADPSVRITQFLGKDNVPFHTVWLPVVLRAIGLRAPDAVHALHWLSWYGERFSTREQRGVFLDRAVDLLPSDVWRWALLADAPESADHAFTWERLAAVVNKDLVGQLGNFVHRVQRLQAKRSTTIPTAHGGAPSTLQDDVLAATTAARTAWRDRRFRDGIEGLRQLLRIANKYVDEAGPWALLRTDEAAADRVITTCFQLQRTIAAAVAPVVPEAARRIRDRLKLTEAERRAPLDEQVCLRGLGGRPFLPGPPLFERVDAEATGRSPERLVG